MKELDQVVSLLEKLKRQSQELNSVLNSIKENDISVGFYLSNLKRLSLQSMDLFCAMEKQTAYFKHQKNTFLEKKLREKQRR